MEFELSAEQQALRDAARQLLERHASVDRVRRFIGPGGVPGAEGTAVGDFDRELWAVMVDQGWPAVAEPESRGGLGLGMVEIAVLCEEIGRVVAPTPFLGHSLALWALREAADSGTDEGEPGGGRAAEAAARWADRLATGESLGCLAFAPDLVVGTLGDGRSRGVGGADDGAGTDSARSDSARSEGARGDGARGDGARSDGGRSGPGRGRVAVGANGQVALTCRPEPTLYAAVADCAVVVGDDAVFALDVSGVRPASQPAMDRTRSLAWLRLDGAAAVTVGGPDAAQRALDRASTAFAAELLGCADKALGMSVDYASQRVQFGHPIGSFQAVKHRLADALVDVEGMRSAAYYAAWCIDAGHPDAPLAASAAKAWCSDAGRRVMAAGLQVHGGIGFTWEHDMHLYVKRTQLDAVSFGDADFHRDRLATCLGSRPADAPALF